MAKPRAVRRIMAIDCCEHALAALESVHYAHVTSVTSRNQSQFVRDNQPLDLIVIGVTQFPIRRLFISQLRHIFPAVPSLILRREDVGADLEKQRIRGEFILSDQQGTDDLDIVSSLRKILPLAACHHTRRGDNYGIVREVIRLIVEKYSDPNLDLERVAGELPVSPKRLSRILNQEVGVSFRQLLRNLRIEEAKQMLASRQYSVKEVAMRVGFSDSHYFSRSFKELTGQNASEFLSFSPLHS
jgi:AraC-like DNA-binding protein